VKLGNGLLKTALHGAYIFSENGVFLA